MMRNLNEEINRIKTLMSINEQCGGDLPQCATDLVAANYKVLSPTQVEASCDNNDVIKCVKKIMNDNGFSGKITIGSLDSGANDCYVLVKGNNKVSGYNRFHFSFYADNQVVISMKLDEKNDGDKLLYRGKFECNGTDLKITGGKVFKYIGIKSGSGAKYENKDLKDSVGDPVVPTSAQISAWKIGNPVKYEDVITYYLNLENLLTNRNVLKDGLLKDDIINIINH